MPASARTQRQNVQTDGADGDRACYVYGIVPQDVELTGEARGVGDPPAQVQMVRHGDIAALVSSVDASRPLGRPGDLMAHQQLLDAASADIPVLPLRFGSVMTSPEAVAEELLAPHHDEFAAALGELEGRTQYVVKARYVEGAVLREVLAEVPEAAELSEAIRATGDEDATRDMQIRLGELINQAITAKREADTQAFADALAPYSVDSGVREPTHEEDAANVALLVETAKQSDLERAVNELAKEWEGRATVRLLGPMAPYDFVVTQVPGG
jgi:hypothetical protein